MPSGLEVRILLFALKGVHMKVVHVKDNVDGAVYIGRWNSYYKLQRSPFHNPYKLTKEQPRGDTLDMFRRYMINTTWLMRELPR